MEATPAEADLFLEALRARVERFQARWDSAAAATHSAEVRARASRAVESMLGAAEASLSTIARGLGESPRDEAAPVLAFLGRVQGGDRKARRQLALWAAEGALTSLRVSLVGWQEAATRSAEADATPWAQRRRGAEEAVRNHASVLAWAIHAAMTAESATPGSGAPSAAASMLCAASVRPAADLLASRGWPSEAALLLAAAAGAARSPPNAAGNQPPLLAVLAGPSPWNGLAYLVARDRWPSLLAALWAAPEDVHPR